MSLQLTKEEKTSFLNKINILTKFLEAFPSYRIQDSIFSSLSLKEIVSPEFDNFYEKVVASKNGYASYSGYLSRISEILRNLTEKLEPEDAQEAIKNIVDFSNAHLDRYYTMSVLDVLNRISKYDTGSKFLLNTLFTSGFFKSISSNYRTDYFNELFVSGNLTDSSDVIQKIQEEFPDYDGFPLILNNNSVSKNIKIEVLKKTYRKKDFPKYKSAFREFSDFDMLDVFIESTILQNNRISDKISNLVKFFGDIFCQPASNAISDTRKHASEFKTKYMQYFQNPNFLRQLHSEYVASKEQETWRRTDRYKSLIKFFYENETSKKILSVLKDAPAAMFQFKENLGSLLTKAILNNEDEETKILIIESIISSNQFNFENLVSSFNGQFLSQLSAYSKTDIFDRFLKNLRIYMYNKNMIPGNYNLNRTISGNNGAEWTKILSSSALKFILETPEVLKKIQFFDEEDRAEMNLKAETLLNNINEKFQDRDINRYHIVSVAKNYEYILTTAKEDSKNIPTENIDYLYKQFLEIYEDDEAVKALISNTVSFYNTPELKTAYSYRHQTENLDGVVNMIKMLRDSIPFLCSGSYKEKEAILTESLNTVSESLELLLGNNLLN